MKFEKYHGTGNDFVMIDNRDKSFPSHDPEKVKFICDRHFGVGSDGLILIEPGLGTDFCMDFFNPDGSKSFCGNGSRCAVIFAKKLGLFSGDSCSFNAIDGNHEATVNQSLVKVKMKDVTDIVHESDNLFIHTGSPHLLCFSEKLPEGELIPIARPLRYAEQYKPGGVNVNFVAKTTDGISMRTYERGVEDETLSCGTGVTAAALGAHFRFNLKSPIVVNTKGGMLRVYFEKVNAGFADVWLEGPVEKVFEGEISL